MKGTMILTMGLIAATLVGCGVNNPAGPGAQAGGFVIAAPKEVSPGNNLIGTWQMQGSVGTPSLITFKSGGGVEVTEAAGYEGTVTVSGAYVVDGNKLILVASPEEGGAGMAPQILERFTTYFYTLDGNVLSLTDAYSATRWVKM
jgi:hypothetical protein